VTEIRLRVRGDVDFDLLPISLVIPYFFAIRTDRQQSVQVFDAAHRVLELLDLLRQLSLPADEKAARGCDTDATALDQFVGSVYEFGQQCVSGRLV